MMDLDLSGEDLERLTMFAVGLIVGLAIAQLVVSLLEHWVIESDLADRRRVREIVREEIVTAAAIATESVPSPARPPAPLILSEVK